MKVAALYDIHGNLPALQAVLAEVAVEDVDALVVGGDVVSGPMPGAVLERLLAEERPVHFIRGNADREVWACAQGQEPGDMPEPVRELTRWVAGQLGCHYFNVMAGWPPALELNIEGLGSVLFCHATPRNDTEVFTRLTPEERLRSVFAGVSASLVVCGHTHMQFERRVGAIRVANAGSVGMPYALPGAYWLLLGEGLEFRHTPYDFARAAQRVRASGCPQAEDFAQGILQPPSEQEALAVFEPMSVELEL